MQNLFLDEKMFQLKFEFYYEVWQAFESFMEDLLAINIYRVRHWVWVHAAMTQHADVSCSYSSAGLVAFAYVSCLYNSSAGPRPSTPPGLGVCEWSPEGLYDKKCILDTEYWWNIKISEEINELIGLHLVDTQAWIWRRPWLGCQSLLTTAVTGGGCLYTLGGACWRQLLLQQCWADLAVTPAVLGWWSLLTSSVTTDVISWWSWWSWRQFLPEQCWAVGVCMILRLWIMDIVW